MNKYTGLQMLLDMRDAGYIIHPDDYLALLNYYINRG